MSETGSTWSMTDADTHRRRLGLARQVCEELPAQCFWPAPADLEVTEADVSFISRAWCMRHPCDDTATLSFPKHSRRKPKEPPGQPGVLVTYRSGGPTDDLYATLLGRLHHPVEFESTDRWKPATDFKAQTGAKAGFTLKPETEGTSRLEICCEADVDPDSRSWGAYPPRVWLDAPRVQPNCAGRRAWPLNLPTQPRFSARARKTAGGARALPIRFRSLG